MNLIRSSRRGGLSGTQAPILRIPFVETLFSFSTATFFMSFPQLTSNVRVVYFGARPTSAILLVDIGRRRDLYIAFIQYTYEPI